MELFRLFGTVGLNGVEQTQDEIDETADHAERSESKMTSAFKKIGTAVMTYFAVDKIIDFGKSIVDASATVSAEASAFEQIMGDYSDNAQKKINEVADATGMVSTRLTPYMTSMTAKFKGLGYDIDDATTLATDGLMLASDASAFWDKSLEDSMGALNSFINGSYEGGEAIGLFANDTQLASYAVKQGIVSEAKEWANLDEARKQATRLEFAKSMFEASGATGQAAKEADQYANVQANLTEKWRQFKAEIGEPLLQNVVLPAMDKLSGLVDKASEGYKKCSKWVSEHKDQLNILAGVLVAGTTAVIGYTTAMGVMSIIQKVKRWTGEMTIAQRLLNVAMSLNPIGLVVAGLTALVAGFIYLWNTSESFRNFWIGLWETIKTVASDVWEKIKSVATAFWDWITTTTTSIIEGMKEGWNSFKETVSGIWTAITDFCSSAWETIKNVVQVGIMFIGEIISLAFDIVMLPWRFIWENVKQFVIPIWESIKTTVSNAINNVKTTIETVLNAIKTFFTNAWNGIKDTTTTVFNTVKGVATSIWNSIKSSVESVVNSVKSKVSSVWNGIKSTTESVFNSIKGVAERVWNSIKSAIEKPINTAKDTVKKVIDKIKGFFDFEWSLPKLKLPHLSVKGKFSLTPPSVPSFDIKWYAKGGIFDEPTIFPTAKGLKGVGEAGAEAVTPIHVLLDYVRTAVREENANVYNGFDRLIKLLDFYMPEVIKNANKDIYLDTGVLVGELGNSIDHELGNISKMKERGM